MTGEEIFILIYQVVLVACSIIAIGGGSVALFDYVRENYKLDRERPEPSQRREHGIIKRTITDQQLLIVEPGVICDAARKLYVAGQCHAMAIALNEHTGYEVYAMDDHSLGCVAHYVVALPKRDHMPLLILDVLGVFEPHTHPMMNSDRTLRKVEEIEDFSGKENLTEAFFSYRSTFNKFYMQIPDIHLARTFAPHVAKYAEPFL